jgi:hypothetical protein
VILTEKFCSCGTKTGRLFSMYLLAYGGSAGNSPTLPNR